MIQAFYLIEWLPKSVFTHISQLYLLLENILATCGSRATGDYSKFLLQIALIMKISVGNKNNTELGNYDHKNVHLYILQYIQSF
jgi:hypothetical protein